MCRAALNFAAKKYVGQRGAEGGLSPEEYRTAALSWVGKAQTEAFAKETACLKNHQAVDSKSQLLPLMPVYDEVFGVIRVGGRLRKAAIPEEAKYQKILPRDHVITRLLASDTHWRIMHGGEEHLIAELRREYWPIGARVVARRARAECVVCHVMRVKPVTTRMADLPRCQVDASVGPFYYTGVDYFGPMHVKIRRNTSAKCWGCLFTCLSTRGIHIELADSLETDDFILCLRNFIGRRGLPREMYSDNRTNFKGANEELKHCLKNLHQDKIRAHLAPQGISWHFNPPLAPHWGGGELGNDLSGL